MHGLSALISSGILSSPIHYPHPHKVIQNPIGGDCRITGTELFDNADSVSPQTIIKVTLIEDVVDPALLTETLFSWKDRAVQHPGVNLPYHQTST